jgi:uncharacterized protein
MRLLIRTFTGLEIDLENIRPQDIKIEDIAHSLSLQCRFCGHIKRFYSVAEHSLNLSLMIPPIYRIYVMLHDAHKTYFHDINKPLKNIIERNWPGFHELIADCDKAIMTALNLDYGKFTYVKSVIKEAEAELFNLEVAILHNNKSIQLEQDHPLVGAEWGMIPSEVEKAFLSFYDVFKN